MAELEVIGVPFDGYGRPGHQAMAATVLRECGLLDAFGGHHLAVVDDLALPAPSARRGPDTSLINEAALVALTDSLNRRVGRAVADGRFPFVYGGDCSTLFGTMTGLRDHVGDVALVFVDGHEDTMPLDVSEDGEAANAEIGLLLGLTGRLVKGPLRDRLPALRPDLLAILGPRDRSWRRAFNVGSLRDRGIWLSAVDEVAADPSGAGRRTVEHLRQQTDRWWLHVDLDVLDPEQFARPGPPRRRGRTGRADLDATDRAPHRDRRARWMRRMECRDLRPRTGSPPLRCAPHRRARTGGVRSPRVAAVGNEQVDDVDPLSAPALLVLLLRRLFGAVRRPHQEPRPGGGHQLAVARRGVDSALVAGQLQTHRAVRRGPEDPGRVIGVRPAGTPPPRHTRRQHP